MTTAPEACGFSASVIPSIARDLLLEPDFIRGNYRDSLDKKLRTSWFDASG